MNGSCSTERSAAAAAVWAEVITSCWSDPVQPTQARSVFDESFAKVDGVIDLVAKVPVEGDNLRIRAPYLQIHFRTAKFAQRCFDMLDECAANAEVSCVWRGGQVVHPSAVSLIAGHRCTDDAVLVTHRHEEKLGLDRKLPRNVFPRIVPWLSQAGRFPESHDGLGILRSERSDAHRISLLHH